MRTIIVILAMLLVGCGSLVPTERQQSQSVKSTEALAVEQERTIQRVFEVTPGLALADQEEVRRVPGKPISHEAPATVSERVSYISKTKTGADTDSKSEGSSETSIPLGVKIALVGIGLLILVFALKSLVAWAKGTAIGQAAGYADDMLREVIRRKRAEAAQSTDTAFIARVQAEIAELEADRGRLAAKKGKI